MFKINLSFLYILFPDNIYYTRLVYLAYLFLQSIFFSLVRAILAVWSMSLLQFSVTVMGVETRAKDREELKEKLLKEEALKKEQREMKIKPNQVSCILTSDS